MHELESPRCFFEAKTVILVAKYWLVQGIDSMLVYTKTIVYKHWTDTVNSLHGLFNGEIGGLDCHAITTEYRKRVHLYTHVTPVLMHWLM